MYNAPFQISQLPTQSKCTLQAIKIALKAGGYNILANITLDETASKNGIPSEIQEQAKILGVSVQS